MVTDKSTAKRSHASYETVCEQGDVGMRYPVTRPMAAVALSELRLSLALWSDPACVMELSVSE